MAVCYSITLLEYLIGMRYVPTDIQSKKIKYAQREYAMKKLEALRSSRGVNKTILASFISTFLLTPAAVLAQDADEGVLEEVIVTGTRSSLDSAAELKRTSDTIIDAITAEDIGVFSDNNIGEALARIPGVQLERQEGDGYRISVRGLGPRFVRTTLNGRTALSSPGGEGGQDARGFSFNMIPSEVITRATVNKSFQASDIEGGMGGTVDLQTTHALDFAAQQEKDFYVSGAVRATYNDLSGDTNPRGSVFANYKVNEQFGFFLSAVYDVSDRLVHSTESQDIDIERFDLSAGTILNGVALTEETRINAAVFDGVRNYSRERDRDRLTFTGGFQWQPADNVDINFDWTHGDLDETRDEFRSWLRVEDAVDRYADDTITNMTIDTAYGNENSMGVIMAFDFEGFDQGGSRHVLDVAHLAQFIDETYDVGGINLRWFNDNGWSIFTDIGYAAQDKTVNQQRVTVGENKASGRFRDGFNGSFDIRSGYPIVTLTDTMGVPYEHTDASDHVYTQDRVSYYIEDNEEKNFRFDVSKELGNNILKFGLSYRDKSLTRQELRTNGNASGDPIFITDIGTLMVTDFFNDVKDPGFYNSYITPDFYAWVAADPAGTFAKDPREGALRLNRNYDVGEEISALYLQYDFANDSVRLPYRGNIGVRYVDTTQTSRGILGQQDGNDVIIYDPDVRIKNTYDDWLPSMNIAFDLSQEWVMRFAASRSLSRPDPRSLRIGVDLDLDDLDGSAGNWELDPYGTDNYDLIFEWYPEMGGAYAFGTFYKKLDGWISNGEEDYEFDAGLGDGQQTFEITRPVNTDGGTILGFEFSFHLPFDIFTDGWASGFGLNGSYTYIDAEMDGVYPGTDDTIDLLGTSDNSGNLVAYYEKGHFGSRLAVNWREDFLYQEGAEGFLEYTDGTTTVDLNLDWRFNRNWRLRFSANNLTDEQTRRYFLEPDLMSDIRDNGRTYVLELRGNM